MQCFSKFPRACPLNPQKGSILGPLAGGGGGGGTLHAFGVISSNSTFNTCLAITSIFLAIKNLRRGGGIRLDLGCATPQNTTFFIAGEPQKLDRQKYASLKSSFHKHFKTTSLRSLRGIGKTLF